MPEPKLSEYVARVRAYLHTPEACRRRRELMTGRGWSYERFVMESVMSQTRLVIYEKISAVTDQVIIEELQGEPEAVSA